MTILQILKNHYKDELLTDQRLGDLPDIEKEEWGKISSLEAQELLDWTLSQKWICEQDVLYDWMCGLFSPALKILDVVMDKKFDIHYSTPSSDENKVLMASACAIGIRCGKLPQEFKSYIVQGVTEGEPLWLAMDFLQWTEDFSIANIALQRIAQVDESGLKCSSIDALANSLMDALEDNDENGQKCIQWLQGQFHQEWFSALVVAMSSYIWNWKNSRFSSYTSERLQGFHQRTQTFFKNIPSNTIATVICVAQKSKIDAKYLDSLMPLLPDGVQKDHMHNPFFDSQPYIHQLRFNQHLKDSVECFGASAPSRKM